jgi:predicted AAA+ superfamily ATPase
LARHILTERHGEAADRYLNWDDDVDRTRVLAREFPLQGMLVFDELHKFGRWRNYLKGLYDSHGQSLDILVTGSARLDLYRRGGDSLQGRYHHVRLLPFSLLEAGCTLQDLMQLGPFPEPLMSGSTRTARRWSRAYRSRLIREDVQDLERIEEIGALEQLSARLPDLVGSPLSINALREDLQVAHKTAARWLDILERLLFLFRVAPFGAPRIKAVKKTSKHYLFDWTTVHEDGPRFENLVAFHLLKECHWLEDSEGHDCELRFFRDVEGREVDFVQLIDGRPERFVECKLSETRLDPSLAYLKRKFPEVDAVQLVAARGVERFADPGIRITSAETFLAELTV